MVQHLRETPRSFVVKTERGSILSRNRRHLRPTGERFCDSSGTTVIVAKDLPPPTLPPEGVSEYPNTLAAMEEEK